jgi:hypothetical protein
MAAADSTAPLTRPRFNIAKKLLGEAPAAWGRYFNGFHTNPDEYDPSEAALFDQLGLKLFPIAQQTPKVAGSALDGAAHAAVNVYKFISRLGVDHLAASGREYLMFLDVEAQPSLSADYYLGWSKTLVSASRDQSEGKFTILPAVYARTGDAKTWSAIADATTRGAEPCRGAWVARYHNDACKKPRPDWETTFLTPSVALNCPILLWQFAIDCPDGNGVDCDLITPDAGATSTLLARLAVPAAPPPR